MSFIPKNQLHIDKHLSNVALNYKPVGFFAQDIAPIVIVNKQTDLIPEFSQADLWRIDDTTRAPGAEANRVSISVSSQQYVAKNYALRADITIEDRANADPNFIRTLEEGRVMGVQDKLMLDWDRRVALQVTSTSNVGTSANVASSWAGADGGFANADPYGDILNVMDDVEDGTGYRPNAIVFGGEAWREFRQSDTVIDKVRMTGVTGAGMAIAQNQVRDLFEVERVSIARAYFNSADEGQAQTLARIFDPHVLVYYVPPRASIVVPSFMYSFRWSGNGLSNMTVERLPFDRRTKSEGVEIGYYQDELITSSALGGLVTNVTCSQ